MAKQQKSKERASLLKRISLSFHWRTWLPAIILGILYLLAGMFWWHIRVFLTIAILCMIVSVAAILCIIFVFKDQRFDFILPTAVLLALVSIFCIIDTFGFYCFVESSFLPFWKISLLLSLPIGIFITLLSAKNAKFGAKIACATVLIGIIFLFVEINLWHLNYILDFHEPTKETARIEQKNFNAHHKSADTCDFLIHVDGKEYYLQVSNLDYASYQEGDLYEFYRYKGAFGEPFFLAKPYGK